MCIRDRFVSVSDVSDSTCTVAATAEPVTLPIIKPRTIAVVVLGTVYTVVIDVPIPAGGSLESLGGGKLVLQTTDILRVTSDTASSLDVSLSIMEIT